MISGDLLSKLLSPHVNAVRYAPRIAKARDPRKSSRARRNRRNEIAFQSRKRNRQVSR